MKRKVVNIAKKIIPYDFRIFLRKLNWRTRYVLQKNFSTQQTKETVYCPIAEKEFPFFLKLNGDLVTPVNGAKGRQRLVWLFLKKELGILNNSRRILHVAPELPYFEILTKIEKIDYHPGDKMVNGYSNQKGVKNIDLTDLDYEDNKFDLIICNHVLEHIPDDKMAMAEMYRVLKNGGSAIITVPINEASKQTYEDFSITTPTQRKKHFGQWDHVRWYGLDIADRLEAVGFEVDMIKYAEKYAEKDVQRYGLKNNIIVKAVKTSSKNP